MNLEQLVLASSTVDGVFKIDRKDPVCAFTVDINIAPDDKATPAFGDRFASTFIFGLAFWGFLLMLLEVKKILLSNKR